MHRALTALLLTAPLLVTQSIPAHAAVRFVRVSWTNPTATSTEVTVTWNSDSAADGSVVEYGLTQAYGETATGTSSGLRDDLGAVHEVAMTGLEPDTEYNYHVGEPGLWSPNYTFRTAPESACAPFTFVALGDNRSQDDNGPANEWEPIVSEAMNWNPAFILNTGDLVNDGDESHQWGNLLDASNGVHPYIPHMPSIGNHDDDHTEGNDALYNQLFSLPRNDQTETEDFYYFIYGNAIFVALSTQTFTGDGGAPFQLQAEWLDRVFTEHPMTWKFVYFHHPIYTSDIFGLAHPPNEQGQNAALVPIFDKHHVDVVFSGHNHWYQRFKPTCCGGGSDDGQATTFDKGTVYVITGGAGAFTYDIAGANELLDLALCSAKNTETCSGKHHYTLVDIDGNELKVQVWSTTAQNFGVMDPGGVAVIDELTITKAGPAPDCSEPDPPEPAPDTSSQVDAGAPPATSDPGAATQANEDTGPKVVFPDEGTARQPVPATTIDRPRIDATGTPPTQAPPVFDEGSGCASRRGAPPWSAIPVLALGALTRARRRRRRYSVTL